MNLVSAARRIVFVMLFLLPLFFLPLTTDPIELNKQTLLVFGVFAAFLCWIGSFLAGRVVAVKQSGTFVFPLLLLVAGAIATLFSGSFYRSVVGSESQEYTSFLSLTAYVVLFFLVTHVVRTEKEQRTALAVIVGSAALTTLIGVCSMVGFWLVPFAFAHEHSFNTVGSLTALGAYAAVASVIGIGMVLSPRGLLLLTGWWGRVERLLLVLLFVCALFILMALDAPVLWVLLLVGVGTLMAFVLLRPNGIDQRVFIVPCFFGIIACLFLFLFPSPFSLSLPNEATLTQRASWNIAVKTLQETSVAWGSGPGTYPFRYVQDRPIETNASAFWDVTFDRASSFWLTLLPTFGVIGAVAWGAVILAVATCLIMGLSAKKQVEEWYGIAVVFSGWLTAVVAQALTSADTVSLSLFFALGGLVCAHTLQKTWTRSFVKSPRAGLASSFGFILLSVVVVSLIFMTGQRYVADAAFAAAVKADRNGEPIADIVRQIETAMNTNQWDDIYARNLGQALLLQLGATLQGVNQMQDIPAEQRQAVQTLADQSIRAAVRATDLTPLNATNWLLRGTVYRELVALVANASGASIEAITQASVLDPQSPRVRVELGKAYLADADVTPKEDAAHVSDDLSKAEAAFQQAIALKADYAPAHYQLALVYVREGRLDDAIGKLESVENYNQLDVGVAFQLGVLYLQRNHEGDLALAQKAFEQATQLNPSYSDAHWYLASVYEQQGNVAGAITEVQTVLTLNPDNDTVKQRLAELKAGQPTGSVPTTVDVSDQSATDVPAGQPIP